MGMLDGKLVIVTGAGGNLGRAICARAAAEGGRVFGLERRTEALEGVRAQLGTSFDGAVVDLSAEASVAAAFDAAERRFGRPWGVVHTAGTWAGGTPVAGTPLSTLESMVAVNLTTTFLVAREAMRRFADGTGRLVTIGALTAHEAKNTSGAAAYNASKAAVIALTKSLAEEGRARGVFANCIAPGTMDTPQNRAAMPDADPARWASLAEVAEVAVQALSPASGLTGAVLPVPGRG